MKRLQIRYTLIIWILIPGQVLLSQVSKDNYTGNWETPASWDPVWPEPKTVISGPGVTVSIYGCITRNGSLEFYGPTTNLIINDTLVIKGDLTLGNNNYLTVNDGGVLIIRGNLSFHDNSIIVAGDSYIVVTGNIIKTGSENMGSFTGSGDPVKLFIGGSVPPQLDNNHDYPVLNCSDPPTLAYDNSGCSYGNMTDIADDPIIDFFRSTCSVVNISSNNPVCKGDNIEIFVTATNAVSYRWTGPGGFTSNSPNLLIPGASAEMTGQYNLMVTATTLCTVTTSTMITVNPIPDVLISDPAAVCSPETIDLTSPVVTSGSTPGIEFTYWRNEEATSALSLPGSVIMGTYFIKGATAEGCFRIKPVTVTVNPSPLLVINDPAPVCAPATIDLTSPAVTAGSTPGLACHIIPIRKAPPAILRQPRLPAEHGI
jgi:hypothetical protein